METVVERRVMRKRKVGNDNMQNVERKDTIHQRKSHTTYIVDREATHESPKHRASPVEIDGRLADRLDLQASVDIERIVPEGCE